jgi:hypothetical protein
MILVEEEKKDEQYQTERSDTDQDNLIVVASNDH